MKILVSVLIGGCLVAGPVWAAEPTTPVASKDAKVCVKVGPRGASRVRPVVCKKQSAWDAIAKAEAEAAKARERDGVTSIALGECGGAGGGGGSSCNLTPEPPQ